MATIEIRDTKKYGRTYKFRTLIGTDENGVRQYARTTWKPPEGLSPVKEKKMAEAEAYRWKQEIKNGKSLARGVRYDLLYCEYYHRFRSRTTKFCKGNLIDRKFRYIYNLS